MSQNLNIQNESQQQEEEILQNTSNTNITSQNVILPSIPQRTFSRIRTVSSSLPTSTTSECLPTYALATKDMPPTYSMDQTNPSTGDSYIINSENFEPLLYLEAPVQPQEIWPITKKIYVYGFIMWPLWLVGAVFVFFGDEYKCYNQDEANEANENIKISTGRLKWAKRCLFNSFIFIVMFVYVSVVFDRNKGRLY